MNQKPKIIENEEYATSAIRILLQYNDNFMFEWIDIYFNNFGIFAEYKNQGNKKDDIYISSRRLKDYHFDRENPIESFKKLEKIKQKIDLLK